MKKRILKFRLAGAVVTLLGVYLIAVSYTHLVPDIVDSYLFYTCVFAR